MSGFALEFVPVTVAHCEIDPDIQPMPKKS